MTSLYKFTWVSEFNETYAEDSTLPHLRRFWAVTTVRKDKKEAVGFLFIEADKDYCQPWWSAMRVLRPLCCPLNWRQQQWLFALQGEYASCASLIDDMHSFFLCYVEVTVPCAILILPRQILRVITSHFWFYAATISTKSGVCHKVM